MTPSLQNLLDSGSQLLQSRRLDEAAKLVAILLERYPGQVPVHLFAADVDMARGDRKGAIARLDSLPASDAGKAHVLLRKAQFLFADRRRAEARATAEAAALCIEPDLWQLRTLARILSDCQQPEAARTWLEHAQQVFPGNVQILFDLAVTGFHLNRVADAERQLAQLLEIDPFHPGALHLRSQLRTQTASHNHCRDLEARMVQQPQRVNLVAGAGFALAKEYEDLQQYEQSFAALERAARAYRSTLNYNASAESSAQTAIRNSFTALVADSLGAGYPAAGPIFVIGMPRTGTTLVERLLSSHSQVGSVGELTDFPLLLTELVQELPVEIRSGLTDVEAALKVDFATLGQRYTAAARQLAGEHPYFVDKLPYNFLYSGYILAALPKARIIHLTRDPLDTCYAVYKTLFFGAYSFSYQLDELADYYVNYRRHMEHWRQVLPGRILDVAYEDLVQNPAVEARRMIDWCGLPWEDSVLAFQNQQQAVMTASAMQIRKPLNANSIGSWRRAGTGFDQMRERLLREKLLAPDA